MTSFHHNYVNENRKENNITKFFHWPSNLNFWLRQCPEGTVSKPITFQKYIVHFKMDTTS